MDLLEILSAVSVLNRDNGRVFTDTTRLDVIAKLLKDSSYTRINEEGLFHLYSKKRVDQLREKKVIVVSTHVDCVREITHCFSEQQGDGILKGTYDNSITNAAILALMLEDSLPDDVIVAFTGDEEEDSNGASQLAGFLKNNNIKIKHIFVLDVTEVGWAHRADFTIENDFLNSDFCEEIVNYIERCGYSWRFVPEDLDEIPEFVPKERVEHIEAFADESWEYDECDIECCSFCLPSEGEMHCNDGILVRESSFRVYTRVLGELLRIGDENQEGERGHGSMKSYDIDHYRTLYVVPFEFKSMEDDFASAVKRIGDALGEAWELSKPYFNERASGERDVYLQVTHEFDCTHGVDKKMGCFWKKRGPINDTTTISVRNVEGKVRADICSAGLYAFRTGIGFLCYEAVFRIEKAEDPKNEADGVTAQNGRREDQKLTSEQLYQIQFYFKELAHERKPVIINGESEAQGFGRHIAKFLQKLDVWYPASRKNACLKTNPEEPELVPDKALLFTYVVFKHDPNWVADLDALSTVYYLTHGYKESYHMSQDAERAIMRPFANCFWGASKEGCGHISWPTGAGLADNSPFFCQNSHALKTINDYFTLYIRALYLSYSLFHLAKELDDLSCDYRDYFDYENVNTAVEEQLRRIRNLRAKINVFLAKSVMTSVSHIQHQNEFYAHVIKQLRVNQDIASVQAGLDALGALSESAVDANKTEALRLEREREKESDEKFQAGLACITLLALFSALADAYQVVDGIRNGHLEKWIWAIVFFFFLICLVAFAIALYFSWDVLKRTILNERDRKKKEKIRKKAKNGNSEE